MTLDELIALLRNSLNHMQSLKAQAAAIGDVEQVCALELKIAETEVTLAELRAE